MLEVLQNKLIFRPKRLDKAKPLDLSIPHEELFLDTPDGSSKIHGVFFPASGDSKGMVLYFHGNSANLMRWSQYAEDFTQRGYDILQIDYPGFGKSDGAPTEEALYHSAELARQWAEERVSSESVIIYGRSIGCVPASYIAARYHCQQLVLETPFYSLKDLFEHHPLYRYVAPIYRMPVYEYVSHVKHSVSIFQGTKDRIVPLRSAARLKEVLKEGDNFFVIPGGRHKDLGTFKLYQEKLSYILK